MLNYLKKHWLSNVKGDSLSGVVVALALIPEAIAFSIIAGVDPKVGLYASFCICVVTALVGSRPGMISGATGAMALLMVTLVKDHGLEYLLAASFLAGVIQIAAGYLKLGNLMNFVSKSVITGFVNALAILIFMAQLPELINVSSSVYLLVALGLAIIYLLPYFPKFGQSIPSPLVAIVVITLVSLLFGLDVRTIGDMGKLPDSLPVFLIPNIPFTFDTLATILPYSIALSLVGLLESLMTATIVDDLTDTESNKNNECKGQGVANIVASLFGGMAGCAMIGQSIINIKSGGLTRLSSMISGVVLLLMVVFVSDWLKLIPMAALVSVMIMVSIGTFSWRSLVELKDHTLPTNITMLATVAVVVFTHNLAIGVAVGVVLSALFYAHASKSMVFISDEVMTNEMHTIHKVKGHVFFASSEAFVDLFDYEKTTSLVTIDITDASFLDNTSVEALDKVVFKFRKKGAYVEVAGMDTVSANLIYKHAMYHKHKDLTAVSITH
ncbi:SulP family inorganic anion transporter [Vibrio splendidus]|uniref:SulP family inorganic anion transporter n=1 Tax=Vibrio splendidus TaxID=29497 RepID=UPI000C85C407|nr:SulP family inorganic anion transporter [Vibrio splendidus]PMK10656.1 sodium-independent anion transporter [Vibrio splendidus]|tara:strand:- start:168 stop:1658 length:1491 start_codon:yes stop_codon:yes gene_type:complete